MSQLNTYDDADLVEGDNKFLGFKWSSEFHDRIDYLKLYKCFRINISRELPRSHANVKFSVNLLKMESSKEDKNEE